MNMLYVFVASRNLLLPLFDAHPIITPSNYSRYIHLSPQHNSTMVGELPDIPQCFDDKISTCPLKNPTYCYSSIVQSPHFFSVFFWQIKTTYGRFFQASTNSGGPRAQDRRRRLKCLDLCLGTPQLRVHLQLFTLRCQGLRLMFFLETAQGRRLPHEP